MTSRGKSHLSWVQTVEFFAVEIGSQSSLLPRFQYASGLRHIEHSLLAKYIHVVNVQFAFSDASLDVGQLLVDYVVGGLAGGAPPATTHSHQW
jgi:hypothetical protein